MKTKACLSVVVVSVLALLLTWEVSAFAQDQVAQQPTTSSVPNLIRYGGVLKDADGGVRASQTVGVTFAIYKQQDGGVALWTEVCNVTTDAAGQYSVMLGSTKSEGVPAELFSEQEQRFLGVQVQGQAEQARVLLVSVPYAFKAHEAETLGGLPASAFIQANPSADPGTAAKTSLAGATSAPHAGSTAGATQPPIGGSGTKNFIAIWTSNDTLGNSALFQTGGNVGLGTTNPQAKLAVVGGPANTNGGRAISGIGANSGVSGHATASSGYTSGVSGRADSVNGSGVYGESVNWVGVGGMATAASGSPAYGVWGDSLSTSGVGVAGYADAISGNTNGVYGVSASTGGNGVFGIATATSGFANGVNGQTASPGGAAVYAVNLASSGGIGVNGTSNATSGSAAGVQGRSASTSGNGVFGDATATSGFANGVSGQTASPGGAGMFAVNLASSGGVGVNGTANATSGSAIGVKGQSASTSGNGVFGDATATSGVANGVGGQTASPSGYGVYAVNLASTSDGGAGVIGISSAATGSNSYGVFAESHSISGNAIFGHASATSGSPHAVVGFIESPNGVAGQFVAHAGAGLVLQGLSGSSFTQVFTVDASGNGYFGGNLNVTGNLTKGSGSFKIDHPLDPENKYLSHSFVESPDMMDVYNGNVTTDKRGRALVALPDYFQSLNRDFRYQLTVIGQFAEAIVGKEIGDNHFTIKTNKPGVKVSWQVTGIRQDAYANAHRIPVEEQKPEQERGKYLHPEVFGAGGDKSMSAQLH